MGNEIFVTKHHGLGNDFLVLLDMADSFRFTATEIKALLDRRIGIGSDGFIRAFPASPDSPAVASMQLFNSDGSRAEMSGNGIRCLAQALIDADLAPLGVFSIDTDAGLIQIQSTSRAGDTVATISVGMGLPQIRDVSSLSQLGHQFKGVRVDIGNPHFVLIPESEMSLEDLDDLDIAKLGPELESQFSGGMNVEWILVMPNREDIYLRVWERGAGITQACGTGTTASGFVAHQLGLVEPKMIVHNPGGDLILNIADDQCYLTGPAQKVGEVQVSAEQLRDMVLLVK